VSAAKLRVAQLVTERDWQSFVVECARRYGWRVHHHFDSRRSEPGWPDLVCARPARGEVLFVELKSEGGKVTDAQGWWLAALEAAGCEAHVWRPSDADAVVARLARTYSPESERG